MSGGRATQRMLRLGSLAELCDLLASDGASVHLFAGGLSRPRQEKPLWLDLRRVDGLGDKDMDDEGLLRLGATLALQDLADDENLRRRCRLLALACAGLGRPQWRRRVSLGGVVLRAEPGRGLGAALDCLEAQAVLVRPGGERRLPLLAGRRPVLDEGEVLESIRLPLRRGRQFSFFAQQGPCSLAVLARRHHDASLSQVRVALEGGGLERTTELAGRVEGWLGQETLCWKGVRELGTRFRSAWGGGDAGDSRLLVGRLQGALLRHVDHMARLRRRQEQRKRRRKR